jgi:hypothetical protein
MRSENRIGESNPNKEVEEVDNPSSSTTAFEDSLKKIELKPRKYQKQLDMSHFLRAKTKPMLNPLSNKFVKKRGIKWFISGNVRFISPNLMVKIWSPKPISVVIA